MSRECDVRNAIQQSLVATGAFGDAVFLSGLPENFGFGASEITAAVIEPSRTRRTAEWGSQEDGSIARTATVIVTLLARHPDPQLRDELAEQLANYLGNAVEGQVLVAGFTVPGKTKVEGLDWIKATPPERRIRATIVYDYEYDGWDNLDTNQ